jgi:ABC-type transport system involved in multi-copper enzyme maturation permease subunit
MIADLEAGLYRLVQFNPCVTIHELRLRMRGVRAFWVLFFYAGIAAGTFLIALWVTAWQSTVTGGPGLRQPNLGRIVLHVLAYTQLTLVLLILPAYSAGAITMEREKRTLEMLRATLLSPGDVVTGKLLVVLALGAMLLLTTLPIAAWSLMLGGVAPEEIAMVYSYLLVAAVFAAALGMLFSSFLGRSLGAVVATYAALLAIAIVPAIILSIIISVMMMGGPSAMKLGPVWGALLLGLGGTMCAWLLFLAVRWVWRRLPGRRFKRLATPAAALAAFGFLVCLLMPGGSVLKQAAALRPTWIIMVEPYVTLVGLIEGGEVTRELIGYSHTVGSSSVSVQFLVWAVSSATLLVLALCCWALAVRAYRVRA